MLSEGPHRPHGDTGTLLPGSLAALVRDTVEHDVAAADPSLPIARTLGEALLASGLWVAYQPIVTLLETRPVALEALVRFDTERWPELGDAATVVGAAEAAGLVGALGAEVLATACTTLAWLRRRSGYERLQMHVNVSPLQLRDGRFVELVRSTLTATALPADALVLELTETAAFEEGGFSEEALSTLTASGIEIAIDDFGTGFASLALLAATPARSIKLDRSFIRAVGEPGEPARGRAQVVQAAIGLARSLGLKVVAEGIESPLQARSLEGWGCEFGQGYLFGRPARDPRDAFPAVTRRRTPPPGSRRPLSSDAMELALAVATVVLRSGRPDTLRRVTAQELAAVLAASDLERGRTDRAVVLATLVDDPLRLAEAPEQDAAMSELVAALRTRPTIGPRASAAGVAAAAWELVGHRRAGLAPTAALRATLGPEAAPDPELVERISAWWASPPPQALPLDHLRGPERRLRDRDRASSRLRSLTSLTQAIGAPGSLEDVLEVTGEEARSALGAASLSISRFERDRNLVRTLVNVGELAPWEERRPADETYSLTEHEVASRAMLDRTVHIEVRQGATTDVPSVHCSSGSTRARPRSSRSRSTTSCGASCSSPPRWTRRPSRRPTSRSSKPSRTSSHWRCSGPTPSTSSRASSARTR